jgi:hypothetical protein
VAVSLGVALGVADGVSLGVGLGAGSADGGPLGVGVGLGAEGLGAGATVGLGAVAVGVGVGTTTGSGCGVWVWVWVPAGPVCRRGDALGDPAGAGAARRSSGTAGEDDPAAGAGTTEVDAGTLASPGAGRPPVGAAELTDAAATESVPYRARAMPPAVPMAPVSVSVSTSA